MKVLNSFHFGIQRKIIANMTTESWDNIPHIVFNYEPDVTDFVAYCKELNAARGTKISLNTYFLKVIIEGLKAAPILNSHIDFNKKLVRGKVTTFENIDISMPMILPRWMWRARSPWWSAVRSPSPRRSRMPLMPVLWP